MTMPRWAVKWICASVGVAALLTLVGSATAVEPQESAIGGVAASVAQAPVVEYPAEGANPVHADPWHENWTDETWDDCIPPVWSHWTINLDAVFWRRNTPDDLQLAVSNPGVNPNATSLTFDNEAGPRLALIRRGISGWDVELNYVGIEGFQSELNMPGAVDPRVPGDDAGGLYTSTALGFGFTGMRVRYDSRLYSEELNLRRQLNETWTGLVGVRCVQVYENLHVDIDSNLAPFYSIEAENRLFGLQLGGEGKLFCTERFLLTTSLKAGLFENNSEQATTDVSGVLAGAAPPVSLRASTNQASFVGELGLLGTYRLSETILLRAGYNVMWIDDVSLASEQLSANEFQTVAPPPDTALRSVRADGSLFYHGAVVGVEMTW
ncbi:MAG: BBP7 family outer membrane beta-barrel protein [Pirellulales bacterium]